jgi:hypothetical protein
MTEHVSLVSARRLEADGFKKPEIAERQLWYNSMGHPSIIFSVDGNKVVSISLISGKETTHELPLGDMNTYCPTVEEAEAYINTKYPDPLQ